MAVLIAPQPRSLPTLPHRHRPAFTLHLSSSLTFSSFKGYRRSSIRLLREGSTAAPEQLEDDDAVLKIKAEGPDGADGHSSEGNASEEESHAGDDKSEAMDLLRQLNLKFDSEDNYSILIYGTGALLTLWISVAFVSAIDSIPLIPEVMEVVGFGFTVWFSFRYLIFKKSRDELFLKFDEIKKHILGL